MYRLYIQEILFPVTPGKLSLKINGKNKTVTLINEGEVNMIKTTGLTDITIDELLLPAFQKYPFALQEVKVEMKKNSSKKKKKENFRSAEYYLNKIETWKKKKKPIQFKLVRSSPDETELLWDTNFNCTIENYEIIEDADKYGMDVCVKLKLKEYRPWGAKKVVKEKKKTNKGKSGAEKKEVVTVKKTRLAKEKAKSYVVKSGDCLMNIARKQLNDGSKWSKIYELNKTVIEAEAKKHGRKSSSNGHWIYPGTSLKMPS